MWWRGRALGPVDAAHVLEGGPQAFGGPPSVGRQVPVVLGQERSGVDVVGAGVDVVGDAMVVGAAMVVIATVVVGGSVAAGGRLVDVGARVAPEEASPATARAA